MLLLNADERPPAGLACGSFGLLGGSVLNHLNRKRAERESLARDGSFQN